MNQAKSLRVRTMKFQPHNKNLYCEKRHHYQVLDNDAVFFNHSVP